MLTTSALSSRPEPGWRFCVSVAINRAGEVVPANVRSHCRCGSRAGNRFGPSRSTCTSSTLNSRQRSRIASVLRAIPRSTQGLPVELEVFGATKRRMQVNGSFFAGLMPINSRSNRV